MPSVFPNAGYGHVSHLLKFIQLCSFLSRDLKPENILLDHEVSFPVFLTKHCCVIDVQPL